MNELLVRLVVEPKDEPRPEASELTPDNVVSYLQDLLADNTKHSEMTGWRVTRVEQVFRPTAG